MKNEFRIFPDIRLICDDMPKTGTKDTFEISCCLQGVCEYNTDGTYSYLSKGEWRIFRHDSYSASNAAHSTNCCMITLIVDSVISNKEINELIGTSDYLHDLHNNKAYISHDEKITGIFTELYNECADENIPAMKIKTLELLMMLKEQKFRHHSRDEKVRLAGEFICSHLSEHYTISQLSEIFEIDGTTLKKLFRRIYGCPVYNYAKNRKMFHAAEMLRNTDMKVIYIAEEVGYSNASKFSSAFRDVMGVNPKYYQMEHKTTVKKSNGGILQQIAY